MILHIFNSSVVSGPETLVIPQLPLINEQVEVVFLSESRCGKDSRSLLDYAAGFGLKVHEIVVESRFDRSAIKKVTKLFDDLKPQILHAHDVKASSYTLWAAKKMESSRPILVSTHHGVRGRFGCKVKLLEAFYTHFILPHYDAVLAVCSSDRELLIKRGLKAEKVFAHLNGVDRPLVPLEERDARHNEIVKEWGIDEKAFILGFVGRLSPEKRIDRILHILAYLKQDSALNFRLVAFGKGQQESYLKAMAEELGVSDRISWMGYRKNIGQEMAGFDILLSLSDAEGLPINLLEAGWAGTPIFCTAVDGNLDLINWQENLALADVKASDEKLAGQLAKYIKDVEYQKNFSRKFQSRVAEHFSGDVWRKNLNSIYDKLIK